MGQSQNMGSKNIFLFLKENGCVPNSPQLPYASGILGSTSFFNFSRDSCQPR